jgi:hypothetical protein
MVSEHHTLTALRDIMREPRGIHAGSTSIIHTHLFRASRSREHGDHSAGGKRQVFSTELIPNGKWEGDWKEEARKEPEQQPEMIYGAYTLQ